MALLNPQEQAELKIDRMIFHVVGPSHSTPVLLEEISPVIHADFFLDRIRSAVRGNLFAFRPTSDVHRNLRLIEKSPTQFAPISKKIATDFNKAHVRAASDGAFFLFRLILRVEPLYALLKYDNDDVVRYILTRKAGVNVASLDRFAESFVRKPEALQKLALIRFNGANAIASIRDRSDRYNISDYFGAFLDVQRQLAPAELTQHLANACVEAMKKHRDEMPEAIRKAGVSHVYSTLRGMRDFDPADDAIIAKIFGAAATNPAVRRTLERELARNGVEDEAFQIVPASVPRPTRKMLTTAEGVRITYDQQAAHTIDQRKVDGGAEEIIIRTAKVTIDDVVSAKD